MWWTTGSGKIELNITKYQAAACSHRGRCDDDIAWLLKQKSILRQVKKLDQGLIANELKEYGAWTSEELCDHEQNLARLLWVACCDINEETARKQNKRYHCES